MENIYQIIKKTRTQEVFLMTGFVFAALPFCGPFIFDKTHYLNLINLIFATFLLAASIYSMNSYWGYKTDIANPRFDRNQFNTDKKYAAISAVLLIISLFIFFIIKPVLFSAAAVVFFFWFIYSHPKGAKTRPIQGTVIHFTAQVIQFHLCILTFYHPTMKLFFVSIFFALLFSSGHLIHELKDYHADSLAKIQTSVIVYGAKRVTFIYKLLVVFILLYWPLLFLKVHFSLKILLPYLAALIFHVFQTMHQTCDQLIDASENEKFQKSYRFSYLLAGLVSIVLVNT